MVGKQILLVEDNPDDEALILRALEKSRFRPAVVVARDGRAALDYLQARGVYAGRGQTSLPMAVFLDLQLPGIDGLEVLRQLRADARTRYLPVIILSSSDEEQDIRESYRMGANSYIRKSVDFASLTETLQQLCEYWLRLNMVLFDHGLNVAGDG
jgi:two-component system, response regulator